LIAAHVPYPNKDSRRFYKRIPSPIAIAVACNNTKLFKYLCTITIPDCEEWYSIGRCYRTLLELTTYHRNKKMVNMLLAKGAIVTELSIYDAPSWADMQKKLKSIQKKQKIKRIRKRIFHV